MNAEQKLERIEELLAERATINAEILSIIEPPEEGHEEEDEPTPRRKRKMRCCSGCGKPGHAVTTCDKTKASDQKIRDTFSGSADDDRKPIAALTEADFVELKDQQRNGDLSTKIFAAEHDVPLTEVNRAINFRRYEDYAR